MTVGTISCIGDAPVYNHNGDTVGYLLNGTSWRLEGPDIINDEDCYRLFDDKWIPKKFITFKGGIVNEESNRYV